MSLADYSDGRMFRPALMAQALQTTVQDIAGSVGLGRDALQRKDRLGSDRTQSRLREMAEILNRTEPRFGSALMAYAWYRSEPLAGFSGLTAMQLVKAGRASEVMGYLDALDAGVFA